MSGYILYFKSAVISPISPNDLQIERFHSLDRLLSRLYYWTDSVCVTTGRSKQERKWADTKASRLEIIQLFRKFLRYFIILDNSFNS